MKPIERKWLLTKEHVNDVHEEILRGLFSFCKQFVKELPWASQEAGGLVVDTLSRILGKCIHDKEISKWLIGELKEMKKELARTKDDESNSESNTTALKNLEKYFQHKRMRLPLDTAISNLKKT